MDLFETFPELATQETPLLQGRKVRLILLSGVVYDDAAYYFQLSAARFWVQADGGPPVIGVGGVHVTPEADAAPHAGLLRAVRNDWRGAAEVFSAGHAYVQDETETRHRLEALPAEWPYLFIFTPPRLGGGEMPDALAQAVYLLSLRRWRNAPRKVNLLRVARPALDEFLSQEDWTRDALAAQPWCELLPVEPLPEQATFRSMLALRALRNGDRSLNAAFASPAG